jgi:hypothetical protein
MNKAREKTRGKKQSLSAVLRIRTRFRWSPGSRSKTHRKSYNEIKTQTKDGQLSLESIKNNTIGIKMSKCLFSLKVNLKHIFEKKKIVLTFILDPDTHSS